ncbi:hypothetical protein HWB90_gp073 [Mycobacterium phage Fowlmouth]|uniref:Uncharacterized protein n=1 Tax=Mycobacterium phage Fowlmouth TaxID=2419978 RepID=A0A3G2KGF3_9CAUD|nr:hypothetical protein HWB90_gp073 [Mycobacterium phage Fowlmouth]AYN58066.1 hypothetical protein SEA_FOWLMOUTH_117 [Mycobacterium phage Fowlmouth]
MCGKEPMIGQHFDFQEFIFDRVTESMRLEREARIAKAEANFRKDLESGRVWKWKVF